MQLHVCSTRDSVLDCAAIAVAAVKPLRLRRRVRRANEQEDNRMQKILLLSSGRPHKRF
jgi:hypothetical protein